VTSRGSLSRASPAELRVRVRLGLGLLTLTLTLTLTLSLNLPIALAAHRSAEHAPRTWRVALGRAAVNTAVAALVARPARRLLPLHTRRLGRAAVERTLPREAWLGLGFGFGLGLGFGVGFGFGFGFGSGTG